MTTDRRAEIEAVFDDALDQSTDARAGWLAARCGVDTALRVEVDALLAAHARADGILDHAPRARLDTPTNDVVPVPDRHIGPYRVVRELGRGGMGVVYLAERADGEFQRQVAIKLLRDSPDAEELHRRFLAERQILASLGHPNIAQLLDGGTTDGQLPYLVMEYVDGVPITAYCDRHQLDVTARLRLFMDVCQAVQAAHQNLIIHRDIKPGNILVVETGQVKLLDFGIAKLLSDPVGAVDQPDTRPALRVMTPEYASPEQIRGEPLTTASDVYALGVVLYELMAGRRPYDLRSFSLRDLYQQVCEAEHEPPSAAITRGSRAADDHGGAAVGSEAIGTARGTTVDRLRRQLQGDVDAMVMMALHKEPRRRYGSAELIREDIARYLEGRPVAAQRQSRGYHFRKFIARHRIAVAAGALGAVSLATGTAVAVREAAEAELERDRATTALARVEQTLDESEQMTGFLVGLFDANAFTPLGASPGTMEDLLRRGSSQVERSASQPLAQARMLDGMGRVYRAIGRLPDARVALERAVALRRANGGATAELATSMVQLAEVLRLLGAYPAAESTSRAALAVRQHALGPSHPTVADVVSQLAGLAVYRGALVEAESLARSALSLRRSTLNPDDLRIAAGLELLSATLRRRGELAEAQLCLEEAIALYERRLGPEDPALTTPLLRLAEMRSAHKDRLAEAEPLFLRVLHIRERSLGPNHPQTAYALSSLGAFRSDQGRHDEAIRLLTRAVDIHRRALGPDNFNVADATAVLARTYLRAGRLSEAEHIQRESLRIAEVALGRQHSYYAGTLTGLGNIQLAEGRLAAAESTFRAAIDIRRRALGGEIGVIAQEISGLGDVYARRNQFVTADSLYRRAVEILTANGNPLQPDRREIYRRLATLHAAHGKPADAARYRILADSGTTDAR